MGFGTVARLFHWITVVLVALMIPVGIVMTQDVPKSVQDPLFILHKGLGPIVLVVVLLRLLWRAFHPAPPLAGERSSPAGEGGGDRARRALFLPDRAGG